MRCTPSPLPVALAPFHRYGCAMRPLLALALALIPTLAHAEGPRHPRAEAQREIQCPAVGRTDLGADSSRYIGETERNLGRVFEVTARAHAELLFDEADTLFGKRSEVKDAHDRYANPDVAYLLQHHGFITPLEGFPARAFLVEEGSGHALIVIEAEKGVRTLEFSHADRRRAIEHARRFAAACPG